MPRSEYKRLLTQAYDLDKPEAPPAELAYYRSLIDRCGQPVLEAMCGSGRFLVPLAEEGVDIDGIDASSDMLDACRERCASLGRSARLDLGPVEDLAPSRAYQLIFCGGGSFGLLADLADVTTALHRFHDALAPGGTLSLEVETVAAASRAGVWGGRWWRRLDGAMIVLRSVGRGVHNDVEEAIGIYELFVEGALVETELNDWFCRFWSGETIRDAVISAGFEEVSVKKAFSSEPPTDEDSMLSVLAVRS